MPEYYIGVDLGTTNTLISVLRRGAIETLPIDGEPICPSVVHFLGHEQYVVGRQAKAIMMIDAAHTIVSPKRHMGLLKFHYNQYGKMYRPAQISSFILRKAKEAAERELGPIRKAVITVPAYFNDDQRAATKEAGELAGFEVLRLLSEPTAAAVAYGLNEGRDQTIAVYDLGGGTFDISILEVRGNTFTVKAVGGNNRLGGDDFDRALATYVATAFRKATRIDLQKEPESPELLAARQQLQEACEKGKKELSEAEQTVIRVPNFYQGRHLEVAVKRDTFESLIMAFIDDTVRCMQQTLATARLSAGDIDRVILVGGSTHMPLVKRKVTEAIKAPYTPSDVMRMVTRGAALVAAQYMAIHETGDERIREIIQATALQELTLQEIYPYRLGIATAQPVPAHEAGRFPRTLWTREGSHMVNGVFSEVVALGQKVPLQESRGGFSTIVDNQTEVRIEIYRTDAQKGSALESCTEPGMHFLGDFFLRGLRPAPAGTPQILVTMDINDDGILHVKAEVEGTRQAAASQPIALTVQRDLNRVDEKNNH